MFLKGKYWIFGGIFSLLLLIFSLNGAVFAAEKKDPSRHKEIKPLPANELILKPISIDLAKSHAQKLQKERQGMQSWMELADELENSLNYAKRQPADAIAMEHNGMQISYKAIIESLELLKTLLPRLDKEPGLLADNFIWLKVSPKVHFTSYFSPVIEASYKQNEIYQYPLYRLPEEVAPHLAQCLKTHTCPDSAFTSVIRPDPPYHSRVAIDMDGALAGKNLEIAWVKHPFDAYSLMLQGSGVLAFEDGTTRAILFAGLNGYRGKSMAGYLIETGQVKRRNASMKGLRAWWDGATQESRRAFLTAASGYAFFRFGAATPQGTLGSAMTPWVSMATDSRILPLGAIVAYSLPTRGATKAGVIPTEGKVDTQVLNGLGFAQDTGGAIQVRRIDLYAGYGEAALTKAKSVYTKGHAWLILRRPKKAQAK